MPPISKIDVYLTTKSSAPTSSMGFCQQNQKSEQKGKLKGTNQSHKVVCSRDQVGKAAIGGKFSKKNTIQNDTSLVTSPNSCNFVSTYETNQITDATMDHSSSDFGSHSNKEQDLIKSGPKSTEINFCDKEEPDCKMHSSTCSSLSSLTASENELGSPIVNKTDVDVFTKQLIDENSNDTAALKMTESPVSMIIKDVEDITINKIGGKEGNDPKANSEVDDVSLKDFCFMQLLGKGAFGHVVLVNKKTEPDPDVYALKIIPKNAIEDNDMYKVHFHSERKAMELVRNGRFLPKLYYAFQTLDHLYLVMDFASGGQLLQQFIGNNVLFENHMRVYLAELLVAVDFLHNRGIVHRDIKPENILLDKTGHVVLIDFGLCRVATDPPCQGVVGTQPYIAPEILKRLPHDRMADFWSLGVLGFEMVTGEPPFSLELSDEMLRKAVLEKEPWFSPKLFHKPCKALLSGLMHKNPKQRLGAISKGNTLGMKGVMAHKFFKCIDWAKAEKGLLQPPNIPERFICPKKKPLVEPKDSGFRCHFEDYSYSWRRSGEDSS